MLYLSLFSGIGGFELGIKQVYETNNIIQHSSKQGRKWAGIQSTGNSTHNKSGNWMGKPTCIGFSEIDKYAIQVYEKQFNHKNYGDITKINAKELPDFDLLVGGFPCQSFSIAGKRGGFNDTRGTLFFDIARICSEKRPKYLVLENVKGLLSHDKGKTFQTILGVLSDLGYTVEWQVLNSKNFGVPQNRERVFIIGHLGGTSRPKVFPITSTNDSHIKLTTQSVQQQDRTVSPEGLSPCLASNTTFDKWNVDFGCTKLNTAQGGNRQPFIRNPYNGKTSDKETGTFGTTCGTTTGKTAQHLYENSKISKSTKTAVARTLTGGGHTGGNHSGMTVVRQPLRFLERNQKNVDGEHSFTVDGGNTGGVRVNSKIRRLTPKECERLQGFPDGWTEGLSDTQRYKTLGNAVTVNVIKEIFKRFINNNK